MIFEKKIIESGVLQTVESYQDLFRVINFEESVIVIPRYFTGIKFKKETNLLNQSVSIIVKMESLIQVFNQLTPPLSEGTPFESFLNHFEYLKYRKNFDFSFRIRENAPGDCIFQSLKIFMRLILNGKFFYLDVFAVSLSFFLVAKHKYGTTYGLICISFLKLKFSTFRFHKFYQIAN